MAFLSGILTKLMQFVVASIVMPLIYSGINAAIWAYTTWKKLKAAEKIIDEDKKKYDAAQPGKEQEDAFEDSIDNSNKH